MLRKLALALALALALCLVLPAHASDDLMTLQIAEAPAGDLGAALSRAAGREITIAGGGPFTIEVKDAPLDQVLAVLSTLANVTIDGERLEASVVDLAAQGYTVTFGPALAGVLQVAGEQVDGRLAYEPSLTVAASDGRTMMRLTCPAPGRVTARLAAPAELQPSLTELAESFCG